MNDLLVKYDYESNIEYIWRVCQAKDEGIIELDWELLTKRINRELYGENKDRWLGSSAYRKPYQGAKAFYEVFQKKINEARSGDDVEYITKKYELEKLKKQIQTEKIELNRWIREQARGELMYEKLISTVRACNNIPKSTLTHSNNDDELVTEEYALLFGDAHFGAEFEIVDIKGKVLNTYSPEIFYERINNMIAQTVAFCKKNHLTKIKVYDLGDSIDGILRVSQLMKLRYGVVESAIKYANYVAEMLYELSRYVDIEYGMVNGNHSELRMIGQPKGTFENDNLGEVIKEIIKIKLEKVVNIKIKEGTGNINGILFDKIAGQNVVIYHGEQKSLQVAVKNLSYIYKEHIDLLIAGHFHHSYSETVGFANEVMRTPSIIGVDDYSMKIGKASMAGATIIGVRKDEGKFLDYHIKL